jgi:putative flippase GtrA
MDNVQAMNQQGQSQGLTGLLQKYPIILQLCRFGAIGFLNTALNFVVSNLVSKFFGVEQGNQLGLISGLGFLLATIQSYYWNKDWAFGQQASNLLQNFLRLVWVGLAGVIAVALVLVGSKAAAPFYFYLGILIVFLLIQYALWKSFGLSNSTGSEIKNPFVAFFVVSLIGFAINVTIVAKFSTAVHLTSSADLNKNLAFIVATCVSLIWNFIGYKLIVFKK